MQFIKAKWNNLILANYQVSPEILMPFVPKGTELDTFEGKYFISLVAFMFHETKVLGLPVPYHINFEEVNLRFYVKPIHDNSKRAVVFIKEIVPKKAIEIIANSLFKENYITVPMKHTFNNNSYTSAWNMENEWNEISVSIDNGLTFPDNASIEKFITEHHWGYTKSGNTTYEYEVQHPKWETCTPSSYSINVDFGKVYGNDFSFLSESTPVNVCFAKGSPIRVMSANILLV